MIPAQALEGVSVPRPSGAPLSYSAARYAASDHPESRAKISDSWPTRATVGMALVGAARRSHRPLTAEELLASTSLAKYVSREVLADVLDELVAAGRLLRDMRRQSLWDREMAYSLPRSAG